MSFPAAHSMDTDWFALDADGHVGLFISDEPVPIRFAESPELNIGKFVRAYSWTHEIDPEQGARPLGGLAATAAAPPLLRSLITFVVLIVLVVVAVLLFR